MSGSVWALDWCPKGNQGVGSPINCEHLVYLVVGAHPPGCSYQKFGVPVAEKGVVQIWSIFNANLNVNAPPSKRKKVKAKKQMDKRKFDYERRQSIYSACSV